MVTEAFRPSDGSTPQGTCDGKNETTPQIDQKANVTDFLSTEGVQARRYRKLLDQLIACGLEKLIDIPKIAILGSQSAGKSSILEALSGITFPRAAGTCTRCPSEVRLFHSMDKWVCKVSLRFEKDVHGNRLDKIKVVPFGEKITDPSKVQRRLIQAQKAILNPTKSVEVFLDESNQESAAESDEVQFSENVICIDVKGNNVRDLSVVDLPGLIANVGENENESNIELIKNLAIKEISKPNCVILSCITMSEDFQNQPSVTLAKEADPTGQRTLGVLTKPDRVEEGVFENWKPILEGKEQKLRHSYYVVKNPDPKQLKKMTHDQARNSEKLFFQQERWRSLDSYITCRLGSAHLAAKLSVLLEEIIKTRMPVILQEVKAMHLKVVQELGRLPEEVPEAQAVSHLNFLLKEFDSEYRHTLLEDDEEGSTAEKIYEMSLEFWNSVMYHRPRFLPMTIGEIKEVQKMQNNEKTIGQLGHMKQMRDYLFEQEKADLKARDVDFEKLDSDLKDADVTAKNLVAGVSTPRNVTFSKGPLQMNLSDVRKIKSRATRDMLPNNTPWSVKVKLIKMCTEPWAALTFAVLKQVETCLLEQCKTLLKKHFAQYRLGGLHNHASVIVEKLIKDEAKESKIFLAKLVEIESRFTTISSQEFSKGQKALYESYSAVRNACINMQYDPQRKIWIEKDKVLTDEVDDELKLVAEIRTYWQVASQRFIDNVRSAIQTIFVQQVGYKCSIILSTELGMYKEDATKTVKKYLQEDPEVVQQRHELQAKEATLSQGLEIINAFWTGALQVDN